MQTMLPKELVFELHYLGSVEYSYTLNFSRSAAPIIGQFFNFLNLGTFVLALAFGVMLIRLCGL
jgi:glutamate/tyrosine decarboxylase-like PLP-dependent enzyme